MRYTAELRLRFVGDTAECQKLIPRARTILGEVWNRDIVLGGLDQSWRYVRITDTAAVRVFATRLMPPEVTIYAGVEIQQPERPGVYMLFAAWYPEGMLATPISELLPDGKGLPLRDAETGILQPDYTDVNPVFPQILINRYENNRYLDRKGFVAGTEKAEEGLAAVPPQLRLSYEEAPEDTTTQFRYWYKIPRPVAYTETPGVYEGFDYWDDSDNQAPFPTVPGEYLLTEAVIDGRVIQNALLLTEQRAELSATDIISEPESDQWYAHRPEDILYPAAAHEKIFTLTNEYRDELFGPPVHRQLRGDGNPSAIAVAEVSRSQDMSHNSLDFRPGFRTAYGKVVNATGVDFDSGENLQIAANAAGTGEDVGEIVAANWRSSQGHYANMISTRWDNDATVPGAQHHIAYTEGTADRTTEDIPDIAPFPSSEVSGGIWAQTFEKREEWVKAWSHYYEGDYGLVGWEGTGQPHDNTALQQDKAIYRAKFGFRGVVYELPDSEPELEMIRILAVAVHEVEGRLWFRVAILTNNIGDETLPSSARVYGSGGIKIFTAPVGITERTYRDVYGYYEPDIVRSWEVEAELELDFSLVDGKGWLYPAYGSGVVSPDGRKFCFSYQRYRIDNVPLLHRSLDDFEHTPAATRDMMVAWIVHIEKEVGQAFVEHEKLPPQATVSATNIQVASNPINNYSRTVDALYDLMPFYDAEGTLQYVKLRIQESQSQQSSGVFWRVHTLVFASGKEIIVQYQALDNVETPADISVFGSTYPSFPYNADEPTLFAATLHYIDPLTEDVVYTKYGYRIEDEDPSDIQSIFSYYDRHELVISTGDDLKTVWVRDENWLTPYFQLSGAQVLTNSAAYSGTGPWSTGVDKKLLRTPNSYSVYNYKAPVGMIRGERLPGPPPFGSNNEWFGSARLQRVTWPFYGEFAEFGSGGPTDDTAYGPYDLEGMYNRENYALSVWQPPRLGGSRARENKFIGREVFANQIDASLYTDNVFPQVVELDEANMQFVRYRDRWMFRAEMTQAPAQMYDEPASFSGQIDFPGWDVFTKPPPPAEAEEVGDNTKITLDSGTAVIITANFDLDDAAGISDVTDIQPIGRAI